LNSADEKIGCFLVSFKLLRFEIELLNRKYWEILVALLSNKIIEDMASLDRYLTEGIGMLGQDPESLEEISKANLCKEQLSSSMSTVRISNYGKRFVKG
jgi:hypothetical protein